MRYLVIKGVWPPYYTTACYCTGRWWWSMLDHTQRRRRSVQSYSSTMTMQANSFFPGMMSSVATSLVAHPAGSFESPFMSAPRGLPPTSSVSAQLPQPTSSFVVTTSTVTGAITTSGSSGRSSTLRDFYAPSIACLALRQSIATNDGGDVGAISGSGLHAPLPPYGVMTSASAVNRFGPGTGAYGATAGLESLFGAGCGGSSFTGALHHAVATTPARLQQAGGHQAATSGLAGIGGGGLSATAAESSFLGAFGTTTAVTSVGSDGQCHPLDTLQPIIYRRPFTGAKPPYSYISLITMAIQVNSYR